jgi:rhamnosyl/mannosyltransferase
LNVLHFYKTYFPDTVGGVEQVINQLATSAAPLGVNSTVLSLTKDKKVTSVLDIDGHKVHRCKQLFEVASTPFSLSVIGEFKRLAAQVDIIHYHFPYPFTDLLHFACQINKPTVVSYHSDIVKQKQLMKLYRPLQQRFLGSVDHIVCASPNYLASSEVLANFQHKTSVIPYGLNADSYPRACSHKQQYWRERIGEKFFLFVGMTRYYKGLHILIEAAKNSEYPIVILGAGPVEAALKQQADALNITNIHFLGFLDNAAKVALLTLCYAFVFPSHLRSEAFGISLLEAAMHAKPLISCEIGSGTTYINQHNVTGLVIEPSNPQALRQAMDQLWEDEALALHYGQQAKQRFDLLFSADKMASTYVDLYHSLIAR